MTYFSVSALLILMFDFLKGGAELRPMVVDCNQHLGGKCCLTFRGLCFFAEAVGSWQTRLVLADSVHKGQAVPGSSHAD